MLNTYPIGNFMTHISTTNTRQDIASQNNGIEGQSNTGSELAMTHIQS